VTISHAGSTGLQSATTDPTPYGLTWPAGVAAGRLAVLFVGNTTLTSEINTASLPDAWTIIGTFTGGDAAHSEPGATNDVARSRVTALYRILSGSETGAFTYTMLTAANAASGCISIYSTDAPGGFDAPTVFVSGVDTAHGTGRSCACGAWGTPLAAGDWLSWGFSSDTDTALTVTAPTVTQSGATFGSVTHRNRNLNGQANDCGVYSFDAPVTAGNANAPTVAFTSTTQQCGPAIVVRLREAAGGTDAAAAEATSTGTANNPTATVSSGIQSAPASGAAETPAARVGPSAGTTASGTANNPTSTVSAGIQSSAATGTANNPTTTVKPSAGSAAATGSALDATVSVSGGTSVNAECATATGTAHNGSPAVAPGAGVANGAVVVSGSAGVSVSAESATAAGTAIDGSPGDPPLPTGPRYVSSTPVGRLADSTPGRVNGSSPTGRITISTPPPIVSTSTRGRL